MELIEALLRAFFVGGLICAVGQLLIDYTPLTPARILVSFVVLGVVLGGIGIYQPLLDFAGAGASVPLTGFGALLAKGVRDAMAEQGAIGILTGGAHCLCGRHYHRHHSGAAGGTALPFPGQGMSVCHAHSRTGRLFRGKNSLPGTT